MQESQEAGAAVDPTMVQEQDCEVIENREEVVENRGSSHSDKEEEERNRRSRMTEAVKPKPCYLCKKHFGDHLFIYYSLFRFGLEMQLWLESFNK